MPCELATRSVAVAGESPGGICFLGRCLMVLYPLGVLCPDLFCSLSSGAGTPLHSDEG